MSEQPERVVVVQEREKKDKPWFKWNINTDFDLGELTLPAIIAGGLVFVAVYKDQFAELINNATKLLDIPLTLPTIPTPTLPQPSGETGGGSSGGVATGSQWYKANGATKSMPNARCDGASNRWENEVNWGNLPGYEVVVYFTVPKGSMQSGSHIGLKHGGPNHTSPCDFKTGGSCCCWWDTGIRRDGKVYTEVEHPHPSNIHTKYYGNIGRPIDNGQPLGIRWHIMKEGGGVRLKQWVDTSGQVNANKWKQTYDVLDTFNGSLMPSDYKSKAFTNKQNIEIRISDVPCKAIKMNSGPVSRQITGSSNLAYTYLGERVSNV